MGSCKEEEIFLPWDLFQSECFYPNRKDIVDINLFCIELKFEAASTFRVEFRYERKAIAKYLYSIGGEKSMKKVEKEEKTSRKVISARNFVS